MKLDLKFKENNQRLDLKFGQYQDLTDGGYERGYAEGYEKGHIDGEKVSYDNGYSDGYDVGKQIAGGIEKAVLERTVENYENENLEMIGSYAFALCNKLKSIQLSTCKQISQHCFNGCKELTVCDIPLAIEIGGYAFCNCVTMEKLEFPSATKLEAMAFLNCTKLNALILSKREIATLAAINAFNGTPIQKGTGYIYVPDDLVDQYKTATNWSNYASQIRAIEDYPEICV